MPLLYFGSNEKLKRARDDLAHIFVDTERLKADIKAHGGFDYTNATPEQLGEVITAAWVSRAVEIKTYLYLSRRVLAKTVDAKSFYVNRWNMNRSQASINGTCGHELMHVFDRVTPQFVFGHGDNSPKRKDNAFPYWFGGYIQKRSLELEG